ncbi:hypothetical protein BT63DRAFT_424818 [Microthyrium microscopicum]|uniref:Glycine zipper 2TM domain-containing protein n=1 Tax=Microthyrium microscopicum TaxID=703497 RepID=A0A6A6UCD4_9PEZI|nr:hypothetical protein BT63DRAFT_424818 [Microthyrium microscopicum]
MATLGLKALHYGADSIPDSVFEKIPVVGPRYFREDDKDDKRRDRKSKSDRDHKMKQRDSGRGRSSRDDKRYNSDSYSDNSDYDDRKARRSYRRSEGQNRRRDRDDRDYDSDIGPMDEPKQYSGTPFFPPPPRGAASAHPLDQQDQQSRGIPDDGAYLPRPYNPDEYGAQNGTRDNYYSGHPQEQQPFTPPPQGGPVPPPQNLSPLPRSDTSRHSSRGHSSVADKYRPLGYDQQGRGSPNPNYPSAMTPYAYDNYRDPGYNTYQPPDERDDYDSEDEEPRARRHSRSGSRKPSRSRSRFSERMKDTKVKATGEFEKHKKELGVSALGALAGGIIGNQFGGKKNRNVGTLIGVALGGIGGGLYEKKSEDKKKRMKLERRASRRDSGDGYDSY